MTWDLVSTIKSAFNPVFSHWIYNCSQLFTTNISAFYRQIHPSYRPQSHNFHEIMPRNKIAPQAKGRPSQTSFLSDSASRPPAPRQTVLTVSKGLQGNVLFDQFRAKYYQKVFLERNISKTLEYQDRLLKAENERNGRSGRSSKGKGRADESLNDGDNASATSKKRTRRTLDQILWERGMKLVPDFTAEDTQFGFLPLYMDNPFDIPSSQNILARISMTLSGTFYFDANKQTLEEDHLVYWDLDGPVLLSSDPKNPRRLNIQLTAPVSFPLKHFADGLPEFGYYMTMRFVPFSFEHGIRKFPAWLYGRELTAEIYFGEDLKVREAVGDEIKVKVGEYRDPRSDDLTLTALQGWNKKINFIPSQKPEKTQTDATETSQSNNGNKKLVRPPPKHKPVKIEYAYNGIVKGIDDSKGAESDKVYVHTVHEYTCTICGAGTSFTSIDRLRFHFKNSHLYLNFTLEDYDKDRNGERAKIKVDPAVGPAAKPSANAINQRKFVWVKPASATSSSGRKAFNLREYVEGDNSWAKNNTGGLSETERRLLMGRGKLARRKGIVPDLVEVEGGVKRRFVLPEREDGKEYFRWKTGVVLHVGDEVSESGSEDEADEGLHATRLEEADIPPETKEFMKKWAKHLWIERPAATCYMHHCIVRFCKKNRTFLQSEVQRAEFDKFVKELKSRGVVDCGVVNECYRIIDGGGGDRMVLAGAD